MSQKISKTIVFFDFKSNAYIILNECQKWLQKSEKHRYSEKLIKQTVKMFHYNTVTFDKKTIFAEFQ